MSAPFVTNYANELAAYAIFFFFLFGAVTVVFVLVTWAYRAFMKWRRP